jgi:tetratricopeptide (TPR) repeat protein
MRDARAAWLPAALPGLLVFAGALALALADGGFVTSTWLPAGLGFLALAALVAVVAPPGRAERSAVWDVALGLFAAFVAWNFLSLLWADSRGAAWEGANRALLYGIVLALVGARPWRRAGVRAVLALVGFGAAALAAAWLIHLATTADPSSAFLEGRLARPVEYANANANLWLIGCFCAAGLAASRELPFAVRGLGVGATCLLLQTALLSQSRGAALGLVVTVVAFVAFHPRRWVALAVLGLPLALTAVGWDTLTALRNAPTVPVLEEAVDDALTTIVLSAVVAAVLGALAAFAASSAPRSLSAPRVRRAGDLVLAGVAVAGVVAALIAIGNPGPWLDDRWADFKSSGYEQVDQSESRFGGSLGSDRYDFWRVSLNQFRDDPITGAGADNYAAAYLLDRESPEAPRHPHSLAFRLLGQNGLVGTLLFVGFLGVALLAARRSLRGAETDVRGLAVAAGCGFLVWFVHGQGDWLWEFPALSILALGLLAVAARTTAEGTSDEPEEPSPARHRGTGGVLIVVALAAAFSFAAPGIAARYTSAAYSDYVREPGVALARLDRAASFNALSPEPLLAHGIIARRLGRTDEALASLEEAVEREPTNWFGHFELALARAEDGSSDALTPAREAARLNPRQALVGELVTQLQDGKEIDAAGLEGQLYGQLARRLRPTEGE